MTLPCSLPTTTQSPTLIGRSMSRIRPETKLLTIDCRPKPMPTERAPATMARFVMSKPAYEMAAIAAMAIPAYPMAVSIEWAMPASMRGATRTLSRSRRWITRVAKSRAVNSMMPSRMRTREMRNWPTSKPNSADFTQSRISAPEKPHCSRISGKATIPSVSVKAASVKVASCWRRGSSRPKVSSRMALMACPPDGALARHGANGKE